MNPANFAQVFDWNGTLLPDNALACRANNVTLAYLGVRELSVAEYKKHHVVPLSKMYAALGVAEDEMMRHKEKIGELFWEAYRQGMNRLRLRANAFEVCQTLAQSGYKMAILSNFEKEGLCAVAERHGILPFFHAVLANKTKTGCLKKGKLDRLGDFLEKHKIRNGLVIGDTVEEIEIARHYGLKSCIVLGGMDSAAELRAERPDFLVRGLKAVPTIAKEVFERGPS